MQPLWGRCPLCSEWFVVFHGGGDPVVPEHARAVAGVERCPGGTAAALMTADEVITARLRGDYTGGWMDVGCQHERERSRAPIQRPGLFG